MCSPLQRAVRTGQAIAARLGVDAVADVRFTDRDYGPWTGAPKSDVVDRFGSVDAAPGVESASAVLARARPALDAVLAESGGGPVVVTHDAVLRPLLADLGAVETSLTVPTGSWSEALRENGSWRLGAVDRRPDRGLRPLGRRSCDR